MAPVKNIRRLGIAIVMILLILSLGVLYGHRPIQLKIDDRRHVGRGLGFELSSQGLLAK